MIYTVTFNPALDYVVQVEQLKTGEVNRTTAEEVYYGGKGINVSILLQTLGFASVALGFIAGFTGREIEQGVKEQGIETDFICLPNGISRINLKIKSQEETEINAQGPLITEHAIDELYHKLDQLVEGDTLVLAGSIPSTLPNNIYEQIMERLFKKEIRFVVDATNDLLKNVLKYKPFLIKPNNHELGELFGVKIETQEDIIYYAKELQNLGARNVLISMAGDGAILLDENHMVHRIGVPNGKVVNSVGAGDSMVAGFLAGYLKTQDYQEALRLGTAAGSATAFSPGLGSKELIAMLLEQI
ncbi:1-phosphofructokinase [Anaerosporobacter faecicola]|uniref:1-phosphofructokinase n=1 Tax=Anaerosporobacter faecicola TaxID=2718714 RepID=UPI00143892FA|nr:1-phosphofructokinase [Anaerosporobacter faecicola]